MLRQSREGGFQHRAQDHRGGRWVAWRISKHVRFWIHMFKAIPVTFVMKYGDTTLKQFFGYLQEIERETERLLKEAISSTDAANNCSIAHEMTKSKLPPAEKLYWGIFDDVSTVTGAGVDTTAAALRLIFFSVYSNPVILGLPRAEDDFRYRAATTENSLLDSDVSATGTKSNGD
ncbi:hypothetical protein GGR57DRAFT_56487 [Xylariaceae sp. FL1272]|nr:hypothetical protein GGR57DRAFT_56487 [Xylariaceae sp. FL1272]